MKLNILGQEYNVKRMSEKEYPKLELLEANGLFEAYSKEIIINSEINKNTCKEYANIEKFENKVLRHEIIHAFFHESGLNEYCVDERLVDFLAFQLPKMTKVINEINAMD